MQDTFYKMIFLGLLYGAEIGIIYLFGRKNFPKMSAWVSIAVFMLLMLVSFYSTAFGSMLSLLAMLVLPFVFRKRHQAEAVRAFYDRNKMYASTEKPPAVIALVGDKGWVCSKGSLNKSFTDKTDFLFWLGNTKSSVSTGKYGTTTVYTWYLVFIFAPGTVSNVFKQIAAAAADRSHDSFGKKFKAFFVPDTARPRRAVTAADGSFIIEFIAVPEPEYYEQKLQWMRENIGKMYYNPAELVMSVN